MARGQVRTRPVSRRRWLEALMDARTSLSITQYGFSDHATHAVPIQQRRLDDHLFWFTVDRHFGGSVEGRRVHLEAGTLSLISPGTVHNFVIPKGLSTFRFRVGMSRDGVDLRLKRGVILARNAWELRAPLEQLMSELQGPRMQTYSELRTRQLVAEICIHAFRRDEQSARPETAMSPRQRFQLQRIVAKKIRKGLAPSELAENMNLSPDYFSRLFRHTFGLPPRAWLVRERLRIAENALTESGLNISQAAQASGYRDLNLFSRLFKQVYGHSPRQYLKLHRMRK